VRSLALPALLALLATACVPPRVRTPPGLSDSDYQAGIEAGRADAEQRFVAGYFCLGCAAAPVVVAAAAARCNLNGGEVPLLADRRPFVPEGAGAHSPDWFQGYDEGYRERITGRRDAWLAGGLITGLAAILGGVIYVYAVR
jgi:hypothetical protein